MALNLTLKPGERVAINGAVIVNGDRRSDITVENHARILREGDIMQPAEAVTPARRIYFPIMMMYLDPSTIEEMTGEYEQRIKEFAGAVSNPDALSKCAELAAHVANQNYYKALGVCRALIAFEKTRLSHVA